MVNQLFSSSLLQSGPSIPDGSYDSANMASTVVPFRNGIMLSVAVGYAESIEAEKVVLGSHGGDHPVYPDCRPEFTKSFSEAAQSGTACGVLVEAPFAEKSKAQIAEIGRGLEFDFSQTVAVGGPESSAPIDFGLLRADRRLQLLLHTARSILFQATTQRAFLLFFPVLINGEWFLGWS